MRYLLIISILVLSIFASEDNPTKEEVAKLYVATFNRAPDNDGLTYWLNNSFGGNPKLSYIAQSFFDQPETQEKYPQDTTNRDFIHSVYGNLFNRVPDDGGWDYWENKLNLGEFSKNRFIEAVINGAQDNQNGLDNTILDNKTEVGIYFAEANLSDIQQATCVLQGITSDLTTVNYAKNIIDNNSISCDMWNNFEIIEHQSLQYYTVVSPFTNRVWLDRNIGALRACESFDDSLCFGDYYQWGRATDGHEKSNSQTLQEQVDSITNVGDKYIVDGTLDWTTIDDDGSQRVTNWQKTDGSTICPEGFRVPTITELNAERLSLRINNIEDAFNSFLKLPASGYRAGEIIDEGVFALFWSSTASNNDVSYALTFEDDDSYLYSLRRIYGLPIRCIKNDGEIFEDLEAPQFTSEANVSVDENQLTAITLTATDENPISFSISTLDATSFNIDTNSGVVTFKTAPDYETKSVYSFIASVSDGVYTVDQLVTITINDILEDGESITHNNTTYQTVISPYTGKVWLDRNIGAQSVCQSSNDEQCFGDYYQWGRNKDGHQSLNSLTTSTQTANITNVGHGNFILSSNPKEYDWAYDVDSSGVQRVFSWSKIDGSSICPIGFRIPTVSELEAETLNQGVSNKDELFENFLKFPAAGYRLEDDASLSLNGFTAFIWTNTTESFDTRAFVFGGNIAYQSVFSRAAGLTLRCIKD